jgi:hypothetical protein
MALNREMNAPGVNSVELALRHVDFSRFTKGLVVDEDVLMRRKILRCAGVNYPMFRVAVLAAPTDVGLSRRRGYLEGYIGLSCRWLPTVLQMWVLRSTCQFQVTSSLIMHAERSGL